MPVNEDEVKIREKAGMLLLSVRLQPGATNDQIVGSYNGALKIRLTAFLTPDRSEGVEMAVDTRRARGTRLRVGPRKRTV